VLQRKKWRQLAEVLAKYIPGSISRVEKQKRMMAKKTITESGFIKKNGVKQ